MNIPLELLAGKTFSRDIELGVSISTMSKCENQRHTMSVTVPLAISLPTGSMPTSAVFFSKSPMIVTNR
jgi:hypothetical protein